MRIDADRADRKAITRIARDLEPDGGSCRQAHSIPDRA
jgi:hypothetical protein